MAMVERKTEVAELVREHHVDIWRYLRFLGCEANEAEDLTQETFLEILRKPFELRSRQATAAYLRRVARNRMLMLRRHQSREPLATDLQKAEQVWVTATGDDGGLDPYLDALRLCLETAVNDRQRRAINLHYQRGSSRAEIAEALEMTVDGVKTMLRRARSALRDCVQGKLST